MTTSFEAYILNQHARNNPQIMDDDLPDVEEEYLATLNYEDTMQLWREYSNTNAICPLCTDILTHVVKPTTKPELHHDTHAYFCPSCPFIGVQHFFHENLTQLTKMAP